MNTTMTDFDRVVQKCRDLMEAKNHDYGDAWRRMRLPSITDQIYVKILRVKQLEDNDGVARVSESIEEGYKDIFCYTVFAMIKLAEENG